ncbi:unnamed protein product [Pedinophyceae sp. YPF-701]|nr:unnamed protein product [Pedinophyceae sp. YPF-701]
MKARFAGLCRPLCPSLPSATPHPKLTPGPQTTASAYRGGRRRRGGLRPRRRLRLRHTQLQQQQTADGAATTDVAGVGSATRQLSPQSRAQLLISEMDMQLGHLEEAIGDSMHGPEALTVVFCSAEVSPWSKAGGLGDVMQALPPAIARRGHRVMTVAPRYGLYPDTRPTGVRVPLELPPKSALSGNAATGAAGSGEGDAGDRSAASHAELHVCNQGGVIRVFVDHPAFNAADNNDPHTIYGTGYIEGGAEGSNLDIQYSILCQAAAAAPALLLPPGDGASSDAADGSPRGSLGEGKKLVFVANDWPAAMLVLRVKAHIQGGHMVAACERRLREAEAQLAASTAPDPFQTGAPPLAPTSPPSRALPLLSTVEEVSEPASTPRTTGASGSSKRTSVSAHRPLGAPDVPPRASSAPPTASAAAAAVTHEIELLALARTLERRLRGATVTTCVHNLAYQGHFPAELFPRLTLPDEFVRHLLDVPETFWSTFPGLAEPVRPPLAKPPGDAPSVGRGSAESRRSLLSEAVRADGPGAPPAETKGAAGGAGGLASLFDKPGAGAAAAGADLLSSFANSPARLGDRDPTRPGDSGRSQPKLVDDLFDKARPTPPRSLVDQIFSSDAMLRPGNGTPPSNHGVELPGTSDVLYDPDSLGGAATSQPALQPLAPGILGRLPRGMRMNWMRAALRLSDAILTVSPGYAREIASGDGCGLDDEIMRARSFVGITNGIDTEEWDPRTDAFLPEHARYSLGTVGTGKAAAKQLLQQRLGLEQDPHAPLIGFVGRLEHQKGVDILLAALPELQPERPSSPSPRKSILGRAMELVGMQSGLSSSDRVGSAGTLGTDATLVADGEDGAVDAVRKVAVTRDGRWFRYPQVAVLGTGQPGLERAVSFLGKSYPGRAAGIARFDVGLSHLMMAGCDYLVVPSRFEPCGLVAQCALQYGTIPMVSSVGGLTDFVTIDRGFLLGPLGGRSAGTLEACVTRAISGIQEALVEYGSPDFELRRQRCMTADMSWDGPAAAWEHALLSASKKELDSVAAADRKAKRGRDEVPEPRRRGRSSLS